MNESTLTNLLACLAGIGTVLILVSFAIFMGLLIKTTYILGGLPAVATMVLVIGGLMVAPLLYIDHVTTFE